jgi:hypothetical protein
MSTYLPAGSPQNDLFNWLTFTLDLVSGLAAEKAAGEPSGHIHAQLRHAGAGLAEALATVTDERRTSTIDRPAR